MQNPSDQENQLQTIQQLLNILNNKQMSSSITQELRNQASWWLKVKIHEIVCNLPRNDPQRIELSKQIDGLHSSDDKTLDPILENSFETHQTDTVRQKISLSPEKKTVKKRTLSMNSVGKNQNNDSDLDSITTKKNPLSSSFLKITPSNKKPIKLKNQNCFRVETQQTSNKVDAEYRQLAQLKDELTNQVIQLKQKVQFQRRQRDDQTKSFNILQSNNEQLKRSNLIINKENTSQKKLLSELKVEVLQLQEGIKKNKDQIQTLSETIIQGQKIISTYQSLLDDVQTEYKVKQRDKLKLKYVFQQNEKMIAIQKQKIDSMQNSKANVMKSVEYQLNQFQQN